MAIVSDLVTMHRPSMAPSNEGQVAAPAVNKATPPLWYVCREGSIVGPMNTATLLRGVAFGRVPEDCLVRGHAWEVWRHVSEIREVCAFRRIQERTGKGWQPLEGWKPPTPDMEGQAFAERFLAASVTPAESMLVTLHAAVEATRAERAAIHRYRAPRRAFVTSFTFGEGLESLEGEPLPGYDAACATAVEGKGVWGSRGLGLAQRAIVARLGQGVALRGVAMVPIRFMDRTFAMLEVARMDHPFRSCDKRRLAGVRRAVEQHFAEAGWDPWPGRVKPPGLRHGRNPR